MSNETFLQAVERQGYTSKKKLSAKEARHVVEIYLRYGLELVPDRWGNYVLPGGHERYHFKSTVLNHQVKHRGEWVNAGGYGEGSERYIDAAYRFLLEASKALGTTTLTEWTVSKVEKRKETQRTDAEKREYGLYLSFAQKMAIGHPDVWPRVWAAVQRRQIDEPLLDEIKEVAAVFMDGLMSQGHPPSEDTKWTSPERPPLYPFIAERLRAHDADRVKWVTKAAQRAGAKAQIYQDRDSGAWVAVVGRQVWVNTDQDVWAGFLGTRSSYTAMLGRIQNLPDLTGSLDILPQGDLMAETSVLMPRLLHVYNTRYHDATIAWLRLVQGYRSDGFFLGPEGYHGDGSPWSRAYSDPMVVEVLQQAGLTPRDVRSRVQINDICCALGEDGIGSRALHWWVETQVLPALARVQREDLENQQPRCDECHAEITAAEQALGWPVEIDAGYVCPACYGDEAYCVACGAVLSGRIDSSRCANCEDEDDE